MEGNDILKTDMINIVLVVIAFLVVVGVIVLLVIRHCDRMQRQMEQQLREEAKKESVALTVYLREKVARQNAEHALRRNRLLTDNLSHEIMEPVNAISGLAETLASSDNDLDDEEREFVIRNIRENSQRLTELAGLVAELSHYEMKTEVSLRDKVQVNAVCQEIVNSYQDKVPEDMNLHFITNLPDNFVIHTNKACLVKALHYLMDNAVRHATEGIIGLSVADDGQHEHLTFAVSDMGQGIPKGYLHKVFETLPEIGHDLKMTGLRLMITRTLVKLLGGSIYVDPHNLTGTRIVFDVKV